MQRDGKSGDGAGKCGGGWVGPTQQLFPPRGLTRKGREGDGMRESFGSPSPRGGGGRTGFGFAGALQGVRGTQDSTSAASSFWGLGGMPRLLARPSPIPAPPAAPGDGIRLGPGRGASAVFVSPPPPPPKLLQISPLRPRAPSQLPSFSPSSLFIPLST